MTHLNDLSKAYLEQIAEKKKDDTYLEPDMKKRQANNEKARKELAKGPQMKNPHFEEKQLDPVGKEDGDVNNDGKKDSTDSYLMKRRKAIGKAMKKESFVKSDWRNSISEVMTDIESKPIKEKKVNNKVKINPTMGEAVEEIGGTLIEEIEVDDIEGVIECVYGELIEEGYSEDEVETAIEQALTEATVTMGHDTEGPKAERTRDKLKKKAKGFLGKVAVKAYNKAREAKAAATPAMQRAKTSTKRGIRKMAQKVVDRMSEEVIDEAVYGSAKKPAPTDKRLTVTNADKAGNTPAYQKYKAGDKNYKAADHMKEGIRDVDPEKGTAERKARLEKKRGMKMDDHPQYKKEEVENVEELYKGKHGQTEKQYQDSRSDAGKMVSGDSKMSGSKYAQGRRTSSDAGPQPAGGSKKPQSQGKMDSGTRTDLMYRKAALKKKAAEMKKEDVSLGKSSASSEISEKMSPQEIQLQKKKATIDKMIAQRRKTELAKGNAPTKSMDEGKGDPCWDTHKQVGMKKKGNRMVPNCVPKNEEVELDERTRFAKETGKDFKTGNPSEKGGTRTGKTPFDKVSREMRKTGGMMSSRGKGIQPQGKKKEKGKKGYQGVTPVEKIRNRLSQKRAAKPNPYRARAGESD